MLQQSVVSYLQYQVDSLTADDNKKLLMAQEPEPEIPRSYLLLRKLRMYGGKNETVPFILAGGYYDQPYLTSLCLEACISGEQRFKDILESQARARSAAQQPPESPL